MQSILTKQTIRSLLLNSSNELKELQEIYKLFPQTICQRKTLCCSLLPEMTFIEALWGIQQLIGLDQVTRMKVIKKIVRYFFINPIEISSCPFLENIECLIYENRFFGCRAYGLWSREYYEELAEESYEAKKQLQKQWEKLGISLPQHVVDFHVPYCLDVQPKEQTDIDDEKLQELYEVTERISNNFNPWNQIFNQTYFADFSFLLASLLLGLKQAAHIKFYVVKEILDKSDPTRLNRILENIQDVCNDFQ